MKHRTLIALALALAAGHAVAEKKPLDDDELRGVSGQGISIAVHLVLNGGLLTGQTIDSRISAGFTVAGVTTYAIVQNFGGELDLFPVTLDTNTKADGTAYISIGMPAALYARDFGARAIGVQTDANAPITNSLGSILLNGSATMTGQLNVWAK